MLELLAWVASHGLHKIYQQLVERLLRDLFRLLLVDFVFELQVNGKRRGGVESVGLLERVLVDFWELGSIKSKQLFVARALVGG